MDELDRNIIRLLQADGRMSNVEVARRLGVAESTVRKRLDRLAQMEALHFAAFPDLQKAGLGVDVVISLQVSPSALQDVVHELTRWPQARSVRVTTGEFQVLVEASFADADALHTFLSERLSAQPGVVRISMSQVLQVAKPLVDWRLPIDQSSLILLVDDDPDFVETSRIVLEKEGYRVRGVLGGRPALNEMHRERPDLVILDVMMEDALMGVAVSDQMQREVGLAQIPILMVSSIPNSPYSEMFPMDGELHVDGFITKPVAPERLLNEVGRLLNGGPRITERKLGTGGRH